MLAQTLTITTEATWTTEEIAARKALWTAVAARLTATMPLGTYEEMRAYQRAIETEVSCTLAALQAAISQTAGPAPMGVRASAKTVREMVTYGHWDGAGDVRGCDLARVA